MSDTLTFSDRKEFRRWLEVNCLKSAGVWLIFGKAGGIKTVKADEALEEALCFGWIDEKKKKITSGGGDREVDKGTMIKRSMTW